MHAIFEPLCFVNLLKYILCKKQKNSKLKKIFFLDRAKFILLDKNLTISWYVLVERQSTEVFCLFFSGVSCQSSLLI
jgi:hypothetical protein